MKQTRHKSTTNGFAATSKLLQHRIRNASESRGFAETRLLTHWEEIVGQSIAAIASPVDIRFGRQGLGATLTVLTTGAQAPMLEMQKERICEKVNACYGYRAIARVRITQTAPTGFAEGQAQFGRPKKKTGATIDPEIKETAARAAGSVENDELRLALESLGANVLRKAKQERSGRT